MRFDVLTTFPEMFTLSRPGALGFSIPARAAAAGLIEVVATNIRDFAGNKHQKTDDRPFGGGPGMVMTCQPLWDALHAAEARDGVSPPRPCVRVLMTPQGEPMRQEMVEEFARVPRLVIIAGHYEGIDERVVEAISPREVSLGDYVLSGGELGAMVLIDAVTRLIPGAVGDEQSPLEDSFSRNHAGRRLLDCPHYAKPREWMGRSVPDVLLSGDHGAIERWREEQRKRRTFLRRPDLLEDTEKRRDGGTA
ncbi:MAG TPA: tRNA (guanosine(37)-N1)-methyltransferase TrmD [Phycisphaerales bacterium]|nr:tRNA (guanosine(37)-N1)-methyltransferase TrmD [Phycisphaerales bacterium]